MYAHTLCTDKSEKFLCCMYILVDTLEDFILAIVLVYIYCIIYLLEIGYKTGYIAPTDRLCGLWVRGG